MLKFKWIEYANFLSSGNYVTRIELDKANITMIVGKNGAGKSTILDAISFVIFNKPFRNITKSLLVNTITKKRTLVKVEFEIGFDTFLVVRGIKPNIFEIYKNGVLVPQDAKNLDYQDYLERSVLRCNHKAFCQVVVLGSASFIPFLDLPAEQRRKVVENILDLEDISLMNTRLKKQIIETNEDFNSLTSVKTSLIERIKNIQDAQAREAEDRTKLAEGFQVEIDKIKEEIKIKKSEFKKNDFRTAHNVVKEKKDFTLKEINNKNHNISLAAQKFASLKKEIEFLEHTDSCPTCSQMIDTKFKNESIKSKKNEIANIEAQNQIDVSELNDLKLLYETQAKEMNVLQEEIEYQNNIISYIKNKEGQIKVFENKRDQFLNSIKKTTNDEFDKVNSDLLEVNLKIDVLQKQKNAEIVLLRLLKDDGVKAQIINQYVDIINDLVNGFLFEMNFPCQFFLDSSFNETIKSRYRDEFTYASFSEGEKLRITLAILFTWREIAKRRNSISTNILFFDEILDSSLDSDGIEDFFNIIKHLTKGTNTFIISHNDKSIDNVENSIEFTKIKEFSHITSKT